VKSERAREETMRLPPSAYAKAIALTKTGLDAQSERFKKIVRH
jgi:hypothetical protein